MNYFRARCIPISPTIAKAARVVRRLALAGAALGATVLPGQDVASYKQLSLQELMNLEVTSVSRRSEKLTEAASAVQVITGEDIRRSGATNLPEALRLAPNLQVAQVNASQWAISARGFNNVLANKLLVLIDGRTVYTPLYAGVFWDVQDTFLADIDRIEVISGPGGTLWGANAVNGVINLVTKSSKETQGLFAEGSSGDELNHLLAVRYGGRIAPRLHYRVYAKTSERDSTQSLDGSDAGDEWDMDQGGFRMDWDPRDEDLVTLQADIYEARPNPDGAVAVKAKGRNVLGRWTRTLGSGADFNLQVYYDYTLRDFGNGFTEALDTWDFDSQHRFFVGDRHEIVWGLGARSMMHKVTNLPLFGFSPGDRRLTLFSAFVQDEITFFDDRLRLTLGSKFEHNDFTGVEIQPSVRAAWIPIEGHTLWAAVSRGVRTPARIDEDFFLKLTPTIPFITGNPGFESEELLASELGWRARPHERFSLALSLFYNDYDHLRTAEPGPPPFGLPVTFANGVEGHTYGAEFAAIWQLTDYWRLRGGYTRMEKSLRVKPTSRDLNEGSVESNDPGHQATLQSSWDLPRNVRFDTVLRYIDALPAPYVASYLLMDLNLAWRPAAWLELSLTGQNLLDRQHLEFIPESPAPREIQRSVYAKVAFQW